MWVSIDLCLVPLGVGVSLSPYISACAEEIEKSGLDYEIGPNGTAIEGEWEEVFACICKCHEVVHQRGAQRIFTNLKLNTRIDRKQSFREKVSSVMAAPKSEV